MSTPDPDEVAAEYRRATQIGAARAIVSALRCPTLPAVDRWEIAPDGTVFGQIRLSSWSRAAAVHAVLDLHRPRQAEGSRLSLRWPTGGGRQLCVSIPSVLWRVELWAYTLPPHADPHTGPLTHRHR